MVDFTKVPPLDWQTPIVDPKTGQPSAQFIRLWQTTFQNAEGTEAGLASKVTGPTASTDNAIARYDGITGKLLKDSGVTISDAGEIEGVTELITPSGFLTVTSPLIYLQGQGIWIVSPFDYDGNFRLINTNQDWLVGMLGSPGARNFEIYDATRNAYVLTIRQSDGMFVAATGVEVPDSAYGGTWNGNVSVPTKNAVYDALEQRVPAGGTTGQVLGKASATDYDVDWIDQSGGGGGGGGSIPLTLDTGSVSTTRFLSGMSTYELTIPSTVPLVDGSVLRVRMTYKKPLTKDRGIVLAIGTSNGYGVKHQADHNKVVYRYNGGTETAKTTLGTTNDASVGTHYIEFEIMIADIAVGRHRLSGAVDFYVNQSMTSNPGNNSDNSVAMIGNLRIFAITDSTSDFVKATLEVLL